MRSALGRTLKLIERDGVEKHEAAIDATRLYVNDAMARVEAAAKNAVHTENFILAVKSPFSDDATPISSSN
jgi:hypothetical protein